MRTLNSFNMNNLVKRFPNFELSYETTSYKKISNNYDICVAIPNGKKYFAWFTFYNDKDVCYIFELNKEKRIINGFISNTIFDSSLSLGTIVYGVLTEDQSFFIIEDIFHYKGLSLSTMTFGIRLGFIYDLMNKHIVQEFNNEDGMVMTLPVMWYNTYNSDIEQDSKIPDKYLNEFIPAYQVHHLQYRSLSIINPYLNVPTNRKLNLKSVATTIKERDDIAFPILTMDFTKPQYKCSAIFQVRADIQFDIYHLYAFGKDNTPVYYNIAYVPNYKSSVFMNSLFRNIKENRNLDYIEESDDEDDFENTDDDKYVDLTKTLYMECIFHSKFKKWTPVRVMKTPCKVVHINQLVSKYSNE